jgi:hypothetical protein
MGLRLLILGLLALVALTTRAATTPGYAQGATRLSLPLIAGHSPFQVNPGLHNYVGLIVAHRPDDSDVEMYTVRGDGSDLRQITDDSMNYEQLQWSPDGNRIAFIRLIPNMPASRELMVMNLDGSGLQPALTSPPPGVALEIRWSPRSDNLLVLWQGESLAQLLVVTPDGTHEIVYEWTPAAGAAWGWSPDGERIHYHRIGMPGSNQLWVYTLATKSHTLIGDISQEYTAVLWRASGDELLYHAPGAGENVIGRLIYANGTNPRDLYEGLYLTPVAWLVGETHVLVAGSYLYTVPTSGGELIQFSNSPAKVVGVAPYGNAVLYSHYGDDSLWLHPFGGEARPLPTPECSPEQGVVDCTIIGNSSWAQDGSAVLYEMGEEYVRDSGMSVRLLTLNEEAPQEYILVRPSGSASFLPYSSLGAVVNTNCFAPCSNDIVTLDISGPTGVRVPGLEDFTRYSFGWRYLPE